MQLQPDTILDGDLLDLAADVARHLEHNLPLDIGYVRRSNRAIAAIARVSASRASLAFRVVSNAVRLREARLTAAPLAASPAFDAAVKSLTEGRLIVTGLDSARTTASSRPDGTLSVEANNIMVTGVGFADYLLLEAMIDNDSATSMLMVPITSVLNARRPSLRGLHDADNAVVDVAAEVPIESALMSHRGHGRAAVEVPYRVGLTFGAVALGSMRAVCDFIETSPRFADEPRMIGWAVAQTQAVEALVEASASAYGNGEMLSRAAKVFATKVAEELAMTAARVAGAAAYGSDHPLTRIANDVAGLGFQAPTNDGSLLYLARSASSKRLDSGQSAVGQCSVNQSTSIVPFSRPTEHVAS